MALDGVLTSYSFCSSASKLLCLRARRSLRVWSGSAALRSEKPSGTPSRDSCSLITRAVGLPRVSAKSEARNRPEATMAAKRVQRWKIPDWTLSSRCGCRASFIRYREGRSQNLTFGILEGATRRMLSGNLERRTCRHCTACTHHRHRCKKLGVQCRTQSPAA